ncbi:MAG: FecR domain-containing protein [Proteobacteria bacterium]|nr:FecR domain-containing protein [Pseudomonadota bacterium]
MRLSRPSVPARVVVTALALLSGMPAASAQQAAPATVAAATDPQFIYRFRARDTLIQVSQRLLLQPQRWPELQRLNGIRNTLNIAPDTPIRIPYSWLKLSPDTAVVQQVAGSVTRDGVQVAQGDLLAQGTRIETSVDGSVSILFADQSVVTLHRSSVLRLERMQRVEGVSDNHSTELRLESGRIETTVKPKRDVGRFEIVTPVAISAVRGTQFRTGFDGTTTQATTETLEGTVGVAASLGAAAVGAGFGTRVESSGSVLAPVPLLVAPDLTSLPPTNARPGLRVEFPPVAEAASYRVQLASDPDFRAVQADAVSGAPAFDVPVPADGSYWLRVRAIDSRGIEGRDAQRAFTQHVLPAAPVALAPAPDARIYATGVTLQWSARAEAARYRLQLSGDPQFGDLIADRQVESGPGATLEELPPGVYFWRVAGLSSSGESGDWSQSGRFHQRPPTPALAAMQGEPRSLRLAWATRPGERYRLQVSRETAFARPIVDAVLEGGEFALARPASGTYYARLQVIDALGVADPMGATQQFDMPVPRWLKVLLGSTVLLPLLL